MKVESRPPRIVCVLRSAEPTPDELNLSLKDRLADFDKRKFIVLKIGGDRVIVIEPTLIHGQVSTSLQQFRHLLPKANEQKVLDLDTMSDDDRGCVESILLNSPMAESARKMLNGQGFRVIIGPVLNTTVTVNGTPKKVSLAPWASAVPPKSGLCAIPRWDRAAMAKIKPKVVPDERQVVEVIGSAPDIEGRFDLVTLAYAKLHELSKAETLKAFAAISQDVATMFGLKSSQTNGAAISSLSAELQDFVRSGMSTDWQYRGFSSQSSALASLANADIGPMQFSLSVTIAWRHEPMGGLAPNAFQATGFDLLAVVPFN